MRRTRMTLATIALAALVGLANGSTAVAADDNPYFTSPFTVTNHSYAFGQAPVFMPDGRVVVSKDFKTGDKEQTYLSNFDGSAQKCLTCSFAPGPNGVPAVRPQGDWILFHTWKGHYLTIGSPGYGGMGSSLYVMKPDGSHVTQLTGLDTAHGAGEGEDDYHAYWSPDGKRLVWAHLNWNFATDGGNGNWDVRVADFVDDGVHPPHLANERVVRPANGHWYETQWWAPDGSGFLYTETSGQSLNTELFFCKLEADGCHVKQLTNSLGWDEQAIFTPDMKDVIFMSSRDHPGFYNSFTSFTQAAGLTTDEDYILVLPIFEAAFLQPVAQEATDLYELDYASGAVRRLTTEGDDGWIIPEFTWDPTNSFLMWTEQRYQDGARVPEPVDVQKQLAAEVSLLSHPPTPDPTQIGSAGITPLPLEARTRILRFQTPVTVPACTARSLTFALHQAGQGAVTHVRVLVGSKVVLVKRGTALKTITVPRPTASEYVVRIAALHADGVTLTTTRTYSGCSKTNPKTHVTHPHHG